MPKVEFTEDFDWYFQSGCCGFGVRAYQAGWSGDVDDDVADAATKAGKARLVEPESEAEADGEV
ncbi:hypothetical protein ACUSIJ_07645 [Pseudochelatococcus sp. B33]